MSTEDDADDEESDRLRRDIMKTLSPVTPTFTSNPEPEGPKPPPRDALDAVKEDTGNRESSLLPSEYDSYFNGSPRDSTRLSEDVAEPESRNIGSLPVETTSRTTQAEPVHGGTNTQRPQMLDTRFSWEGSSGQEVSGPAGVVPGPRIPPPEESIGAGQLPRAQTPSRDEVAATYPGENVPPSESPKTPRPADRATHEGLHVVNAESPEAVDLPPRLGDDTGHESESKPSSSHSQPKSPVTAEAHVAAPRPSTADSNKPLPFRQILAIKSAPQRIETYNKTRQQFLNMNTGLDNWLSMTMASRPEHASLTSVSSKPLTAAGPATARGHKASPSFSRFMKPGGTASQGGQPASSSGRPPSQGVGTSHGPSQSQGRITGQQVQAKGKDLLQSADKIGGKAITGAKGLFAKGKSRFRGSGGHEKVDH